MTDQQLYLAIGVPLVVNALGFTLLGIMLAWVKGDVKELNADLKILTTKVVDIDNRVIRIEDKLGITPR